MNIDTLSRSRNEGNAAEFERLEAAALYNAGAHCATLGLDLPEDERIALMNDHMRRVAQEIQIQAMRFSMLHTRGTRPGRTRTRKRSTRRRVHRRATRATAVASAGNDGPPEPPSLARRLLEPVDALARARAALVAAVEAAREALAAIDAADDPMVTLRDGCPELGLSSRQVLDGHRAGGFEASGRPLRARRSVILAWVDSRVPPATKAAPEATQAPAAPVDEDDGVRVLSRIRLVGKAAQR
jgi:hypothetical protein